MAITKPPVLPAWAESGDKVTPSNAEIQVGWPLSSIPPSRQRFNWLLNFLANGIRYFSRRGLPDYDAAETYMTGDRIIGDDGKTYCSLIDNNTAQTPSTSPTKWEEWAPTLSRFAALIQGQTYTAFTTAGAAPNFTLTPSPAIAVYAAGQRFRVKFHAAGAGANVLNVSGLGNKSLKQYDSTGTKVAAVIAANQLVDVEYDGVDMVLLDPLALVQAGEVAFFARSSAPAGYLKANGAAVSRTAYATLFAAIGTTFGVGDGSTTFNLPDLRGEFLRGLDDGRGVDSGRTIGSAQDGTWVRTVVQEWAGGDAGTGTYNIGFAFAQADAEISTVGVGGTVPSGAKTPGGTVYNTATTDNTIQGPAIIDGSAAINHWIKVRPRNVALLACIRYQ